MDLCLRKIIAGYQPRQRHASFIVASGGTITLQGSESLNTEGLALSIRLQELITQIINDTTFSVVRTSTCTSRDYIFHDRNNAVAVYLEEAFRRSSTSLSVDGQAGVQMEILSLSLTILFSEKPYIKRHKIMDAWLA